MASNPFGMATERHAQQVWDRIEQGQFSWQKLAECAFAAV